MKNIRLRHSILLLLISALSGCYARPADKTGLEGKPIPSFNLLLTDSTTYFNPSSISDGSPIVLFNFGPHCPFSHAQMDEILEDMDKLKDIRFCIFSTGSFLDMKAFYTKYKLSKYPNITTGLDYTHFFPDYFEARGVPYIAIYGKDKNLKKAFLGKIYSSQIKSSIQ